MKGLHAEEGDIRTIANGRELKAGRSLLHTSRVTVASVHQQLPAERSGDPTVTVYLKKCAVGGSLVNMTL